MQLADILRSEPIAADEQSFELTVAALSLAGIDRDAEIPQNLQSRINAEAERYFDEPNQKPVTVATTTSVRESRRFSIGAWLGWAVAAAACVALAINIYNTRNTQQVVQAPPATPTPEVKLSPAQEREQLIRNAPDLARAEIGVGKMAEINPAGDIVWSDTMQTGYLRVTGLPRNDQSKECYQLWIVASNQDAKTPVEGATFDVNADGEVVIPIDPRVKVVDPKAFAITVEKPGGVVVSKQERVAAMAKMPT
ncbi:MAG: anti-sigma factor, partial [Acidobacteria bacterium]|nr:anti-sigma factor [Acidobacteriota bacterium]